MDFVLIQYEYYNFLIYLVLLITILYEILDNVEEKKCTIAFSIAMLFAIVFLSLYAIKSESMQRQ